MQQNNSLFKINTKFNFTLVCILTRLKKHKYVGKRKSFVNEQQNLPSMKRCIINDS